MGTAFIRGIIPAMVTPMRADEELSESGMAHLIDHLIDNGVHGVFALGTAGESWALSTEEKKLVYKWTVAYTKGRVPVYLGTSANSTREAIELAVSAEAEGADCLSVLTPYFITPNPEEMANHYREIARSVTLPILLYDLPPRTGNSLSVDLVLRLFEEHDNIVGIKDSSGDFTKSLEYLRKAPDGFRLIMGRDSLIYAALTHGAAGAIAASANVAPELGVAIYEHFEQGDLDGSLAAQKALAPLRAAFALGTHPAMLKAGAELMGLEVGPPRRPVTPLAADEMNTLKQVLTEMGKLPREEQST
jgi:4-hydroxy-tetrahydrodipicolinate synthase